MKKIPVITAAMAALLLFSPGLVPRATAQTGNLTAAQATEMSRGNVLASLKGSIKSKKAKVGQKVTLKTMSSVTLSDGTSLPRGTKLTGQITGVVNPGRHEKDKMAKVSFAIDTAITHGKSIPIHALATAAKVPNLVLSADGMPITSDMTRGGLTPSAGAGMAADRHTMQTVEGTATGPNSKSHGKIKPNTGVVRVLGPTIQIVEVPVVSLKGATLSSTNQGKGPVTFEQKKEISLENGTQIRFYLSPAK
jgi:hypothetical protein